MISKLHHSTHGCYEIKGETYHFEKVVVKSRFIK